MTRQPRCTRNGWRRILNSSNPRERHLGVVGHPIAHSLSPALHQAAYDILGLPWSYEAIDIEPGGLTGFVTARDSSWVGLSVTMPHKAEALEIADSVDPIGRSTASVNTLIFSWDDQGRRLISGYNTDVMGIVLALGDAGVDRAREVAIIGGGATAASALVAASQLGADRVNILVRNLPHAANLVELGSALGLVVAIKDIADISTTPPVDLVISTLPGDVATSLQALPRVSRAALLDVAYSPWPSIRGTDWGAQTASGGIVVSGLAMLAHQALIQVRLFTSGDAATPIPQEASVRQAMFAAVGLT